MSAIWSPPDPETVHSSSSAAIDEREMSVSAPSSSSTGIPSFDAISSSLGARPSLRSSSEIARSISRARERTDRGTQSSARSSSRIEPLMRAIAYVSNFTSRPGSYRSIAAIRPSRPYEARSPSSTCAGNPLPSLPATYLTSGAYVRMRRSRTALSPDARYLRQRSSIPSAATVTGYGAQRIFPAAAAASACSALAESAHRQAHQPDADRDRRRPDDEPRNAV